MIKPRKEKVPKKAIIAFIILAVIILLISNAMRVSKPNTLAFTYENQLNNHAAFGAFSIGDGIYFNSNRSYTKLYCNSKVNPVGLQKLEGMECENYYVLRAAGLYNNKLELISKSNGKSILSLDNADTYVLTDSALYYETPQKILYRYDINASETTEVLRDYINYQVLEDGRIAYITSGAWDYKTSSRVAYCLDNGQIIEIAKFTKNHEVLPAAFYENGKYYYENGKGGVEAYDFDSKTTDIAYSGDFFRLENVYNGNLYFTRALPNSVLCFRVNAKTKEETEILQLIINYDTYPEGIDSINREGMRVSAFNGITFFDCGNKTYRIYD